MPVAFCSSAVATCNMAPSVATGQIHIDARQVHVLLQMHACIHASCQTSLAGGVQWTPHVTSDGFAQVFGKANHFVKQTRRAWPGTHIHYCTFMCLDLRTGALKPVTSRLFFGVMHAGGAANSLMHEHASFFTNAFSCSIWLAWYKHFWWGRKWHFSSRRLCLQPLGPIEMSSKPLALSIACAWSAVRTWEGPLARIRHMHGTCMQFTHQCVYWRFSLGWGDISRNKLVVGLAIKKLGTRPSQGMIEQAVFQFFSLTLPKCQEVDSFSAVNMSFWGCVCVCGNLLHTCTFVIRVQIFHRTEAPSTSCIPELWRSWSFALHALRRNIPCIQAHARLEVKNF